MSGRSSRYDDLPFSDPSFDHPKMSHPDRIPSIQFFDLDIRQLGGTTSVLELQKGTLEAYKRTKPPSYEQRLIDDAREKSAYRRECQFFRAYYSISQELVERIRTISVHMSLMYYLMPGQTGHGIDEWYNVADEIEKYLGHHEQEVRRAEADWIELSRIQSLRDRFSWI
jgi:hypothetical protein